MKMLAAKMIRDAIWASIFFTLGSGRPMLWVAGIQVFIIVLLFDAGEALLVRLFSKKLFPKTPPRCECDTAMALWLACAYLADCEPFPQSQAAYYLEFIKLAKKETPC